VSRLLSSGLLLVYAVGGQEWKVDFRLIPEFNRQHFITCSELCNWNPITVDGKVSFVDKQGKGIPWYAGTGAFSLRRYIFD